MELEDMDRLVEALARLQAEPNGPSALLGIVTRWVTEAREGRVPRLTEEEAAWLQCAQALRGYEVGRGEVRDLWHAQESGSDEEDARRWRLLEEGVGAHLLMAFVKIPPAVNLLKCDWSACGSFFYAKRPKRFCDPSCRNKAWHRAQAIDAALGPMARKIADLQRQCSSENRELATMSECQIKALGRRLTKLTREYDALDEERRELRGTEGGDR